MNVRYILPVLLLVLASPSFASRTHHATERLELSEYKVWTISTTADGCRAVYVMDPDGYIYLLQPGDYIGRKDGKVETIDSNGIVVIELVPDGKGGWKERRVRMDLPANMRPR